MSKPLEKLSVFISGPMSDDPHNHICEFLDAHRRLNQLGAARVYDPALKWAEQVGRGLERDMSHEYYMRECIHELTRCGYGPYEGADFDTVEIPPFYDLMVQLDGWQESNGAKLECIVAMACGIEVVEISGLDKWIEGRNQS